MVTEMNEKASKVVRITMPLNMANKFTEESRLIFNDVRWINILFKDKMYNVLYNHQSSAIKDEIIKARNEICDAIKAFYIESKKR